MQRGPRCRCRRPVGPSALSGSHVLSHEHQEIGLFTRDEVPDLVTPEGYKRVIAGWFDRLQASSERVS